MLVRSAVAPGGWESDHTETANSMGVRYTYEVTENATVQVEVLRWEHDEEERHEVLVMTAEENGRRHKNVFEPLAFEDGEAAATAAEELMHRITDEVEAYSRDRFAEQRDDFVQRMSEIVSEARESRSRVRIV
ncbi:hypothetical protein [Haloarchaeobius amylolyticus]|uniref:hypothetical protein n=1 Tax=Haloarchaeobius amylolyticus TaxID=1198296 RepID=UPI00226E9A31|nr:hypothetical protein [Haloarchaeobius amylolyticus]